jgi:hypothetical protein
VIVAPLAVRAGAQVAQLDEASSLLLLADSVIEARQKSTRHRPLVALPARGGCFHP